MDALKRLLSHPVTVRACQLVMGVIMGWAGLAKIGNPEAFSTQIHNFHMIPLASENLLAITLPWVELTVALALVLGIRVRGAALLNLVLMVVFTVAVAQAVARGYDIDCGCFGTGDGARVGMKKLVENFGMIAVSVVACLRPRAD